MARLTTTDDLYPELRTVGGLPPALQRALDELGSPLRAVGLSDEWKGFPLYARVEQNGRACQMYVSAETRAFSCDFWHRGVQHGRGWSPSLIDAARAMVGFVGQRVSVVELQRVHGWIEPYPAAALPDAAALVDQAWGHYLACDAASPPPVGPLAALFAAAARRPRLRGLLPYTSLYRLCFSRTTGYPYTRDCPWAEPIDGGRYRVFTESAVIGEGDAEQAAALLDSALPAGCGPAIEGTAEDLEVAG